MDVLGMCVRVRVFRAVSVFVFVFVFEMLVRMLVGHPIVLMRV